MRVLLMEREVTCAPGWVQPRSSPQSLCAPCLAEKNSASAAKAPVTQALPSVVGSAYLTGYKHDKVRNGLAWLAKL